MEATSAREFDTPWKDALDWYLKQLLKLLFPEYHRAIDWSVDYQSMSTELQQIVRDGEFGKTFTDKLYRVKTIEGDDIFLLFHIEVQSQQDKNFPERMFFYSCRLRDRYNDEVASLAILGDDNPNWRPTEYRQEVIKTKTHFEFSIAKLIDWRDRIEELENDPTGVGLVIIAHLQSLETHRDYTNRKEWKLRLYRTMLNRKLSPKETRQIFTIVDWFLELPKDIEKEFKNDVAKIELEKQMPLMGSFARLNFDEGKIEGFADGEAKGKAEGLLVALDIRFGEEGVRLGEELLRRPNYDWVPKLESQIRNARSIEELRAAMK
jgi:hypothetical protein